MHEIGIGAVAEGQSHRVVVQRRAMAVRSCSDRADALSDDLRSEVCDRHAHDDVPDFIDIR
jgi:hypothetical protein